MKFYCNESVTKVIRSTEPREFFAFPSYSSNSNTCVRLRGPFRYRSNIMPGKNCSIHFVYTRWNIMTARKANCLSNKKQWKYRSKTYVYVDLSTRSTKTGKRRATQNPQSQRCFNWAEEFQLRICSIEVNYTEKEIRLPSRIFYNYGAIISLLGKSEIN